MVDDLNDLWYSVETPELVVKGKAPVWIFKALLNHDPWFDAIVLILSVLPIVIAIQPG
jgi:hypothetical protein